MSSGYRKGSYARRNNQLCSISTATGRGKKTLVKQLIPDRVSDYLYGQFSKRKFLFLFPFFCFQFLSMKLAAVNPRLDFNIEGLLSKEVRIAEGFYACNLEILKLHLIFFLISSYVDNHDDKRIVFYLVG